MTLPKLLAEARAETGWNLQQTADRLGVRKSQVWSWENGKYNPRRSNLKKIARVFKLDYDELVHAVVAARYR